MYRITHVTVDDWDQRWYHWKPDGGGAEWTTYEGWFWRGVQPVGY